MDASQKREVFCLRNKIENLSFEALIIRLKL
jgi:hypothetical protein